MLSRNVFRNQIVRAYNDGETVVSEGDVDKEMFIIQEGRVRVTKTVGGTEVELAVLERGDFFGEMSLLETLPRSATVRAVGSARLQVIQPGGFLLKIRRDPTFAFEMLQHMSGRIRRLNDTLIDALKSGQPLAEDIEQIVDNTEYSREKGVS